jgi:hypothetical protein
MLIFLKNTKIDKQVIAAAVTDYSCAKSGYSKYMITEYINQYKNGGFSK